MYPLSSSGMETRWGDEQKTGVEKATYRRTPLRLYHRFAPLSAPRATKRMETIESDKLANWHITKRKVNASSCSVRSLYMFCTIVNN